MDTTVVIIGPGQAGLAMSYCLTSRGVDHVLVERGGVANSWRTERWDSLRTLTPNWYSQLPGWEYRGSDPDGFMTAADVVTHLDRYRAAFDPPVMTDTTVVNVDQAAGGFVAVTDRGDWRCRSVVVATGAASNPHTPILATQVPGHVEQITPTTYRNPDRLADGPVLDRWRCCIRRATGGGIAIQRALGHLERRRPCPTASVVSGHEHPLVDARTGPTARGRHRRRRHRTRPAPPRATARRLVVQHAAGRLARRDVLPLVVSVFQFAVAIGATIAVSDVDALAALAGTATLSAGASQLAASTPGGLGLPIAALAGLMIGGWSTTEPNSKEGS